MNIITFTGKRPTGLYGYANQNHIYDWCVTQIEDVLKKYVQESTEIRTGGAQGSDMLAFQASYNLRSTHPVKNTLYLPFPEQADKWPEYGYFNKTIWLRNKEIADKVVFVSPDNTGNIIQKMHDRNTAMLQNTNRLIAISHTINDLNQIKGGTGNSIKTAIKMQIPITLICFNGSCYNATYTVKEY